MAKRSNFEKNPRDYYRTFDKRAGQALKPFLERDNITMYAEPFAGAGDLYLQLNDLGMTNVWLSDIEPDNLHGLADLIVQKDYRAVWNRGGAHAMITNPPWSRDIFHDALEVLTPKYPCCWWLMNANWIFNKGSSVYLNEIVTDVVAIGRLKWIEDSTMSAKDDCIWLRTSVKKDSETKFHNLRGV